MLIGPLSGLNIGQWTQSLKEVTRVTALTAIGCFALFVYRRSSEANVSPLSERGATPPPSPWLDERAISLFVQSMRAVANLPAEEGLIRCKLDQRIEDLDLEEVTGLALSWKGASYQVYFDPAIGGVRIKRNGFFVAQVLPATHPREASLPWGPLQEEALHRASRYVVSEGRIDIVVWEEDVARRPLYHLGRLGKSLVEAGGRKPPIMAVQYWTSRAERGEEMQFKHGVRNLYLSSLFKALAPALSFKTLPLKGTGAPKPALPLNEEQREAYRRYGQVLMGAYLGDFVTGPYLDLSCFQVLFSLRNEEVSAERRRELIRKLATLQVGIDYGKIGGQSPYARVKELWEFASKEWSTKDLEEGKRLLIENFGAERIANLEPSQFQNQLKLRLRSCQFDGAYLLELLDQPWGDYERDIARTYIEEILCETVQGEVTQEGLQSRFEARDEGLFGQLEALVLMAQGMVDVEGHWPQIGAAEFEEGAQGKIDRKAIAASIRVPDQGHAYQEDQKALEKVAGWIREWCRDTASELELKVMLGYWCGGSIDLKEGLKLNRGFSPDEELLLEIEPHACTNEVKLTIPMLKGMEREEFLGQFRDAIANPNSVRIYQV
ncbi:MAG: hypothetical protein AB7F31_07395 [Parachlamydiales bacterium]